MAGPKLTPAQRQQAKQAKQANARSASQRATSVKSAASRTGMNAKFGVGKALDDYALARPKFVAPKAPKPVQSKSTPISRAAKGISGTLLNKPRANR